MRSVHTMNLLPEIEKSLARYGLSPNKTFGQNFLLDETVLDAMLVAAAVSAGDVVIEVGPGVATLTRALLSRGSSLCCGKRRAISSTFGSPCG